jgi:hypothetical protein
MHRTTFVSAGTPRPGRRETHDLLRNLAADTAAATARACSLETCARLAGLFAADTAAATTRAFRLAAENGQVHHGESVLWRTSSLCSPDIAADTAAATTGNPFRPACAAVMVSLAFSCLAVVPSGQGDFRLPFADVSLPFERYALPSGDCATFYSSHAVR